MSNFLLQTILKANLQEQTQTGWVVYDYETLANAMAIAVYSHHSKKWMITLTGLCPSWDLLILRYRECFSYYVISTTMHSLHGFTIHSNFKPNVIFTNNTTEKVQR